MYCSIVCSSCQGQSCSNVESNSTDYEESINEEVFDLSPSAEQPIEVQLQEDEESEEEQINIAEEEFKDNY